MSEIIIDKKYNSRYGEIIVRELVSKDYYECEYLNNRRTFTRIKVEDIYEPLDDLLGMTEIETLKQALEVAKEGLKSVQENTKRINGENYKKSFDFWYPECVLEKINKLTGE